MLYGDSMVVVDFAALVAGHWALVGGTGALGLLQVGCLLRRQEPILSHPLVHPLIDYKNIESWYM